MTLSLTAQVKTQQNKTKHSTAYSAYFNQSIYQTLKVKESHKTLELQYVRSIAQEQTSNT